MQNIGQGFSSSPRGPGISAGLEAIAQVERARIVRLFEIAEPSINTRHQGCPGDRESAPSEKVQCGLVFALYLFQRALLGRLFRTPANEFRAMPESSSGEVIESNLHHQPRIQGLPLCRSLRTPPAGASRRFACKSGWLDQRFELFR